MDNHINFNPEDPSHLVEAIIMEKYIFLKKITHVKEINFDQFEVIYENVLLIAEGHQVNELSESKRICEGIFHLELLLLLQLFWLFLPFVKRI